MPSLDIAMPIALLIVVTVAMLLNERVEGKLQSTIEEKQFQRRDIILLVVFMAIVISAISLTAMFNHGAVFENILLVIFMSSYTMLLFTISYVFSNLPKIRAQLLSVGFGVGSTVAGVVCLLAPLQDAYTIFRVVAFFGLATFCFGVAIYEKKNTVSKQKWYVAVQPPAIFILLFVFFNFINNPGTAAVWSPYLMDVFGLTFAILIILYLSTLFSWKTVGLFAALLTTMDIILVFSGPMVKAAHTFTGLGLPVMVYLPHVPFIYSSAGGILYGGLGLGDFFFAGVLAVQTFNKFGKKTALISVVSIALAFGIWEVFLPQIDAFFNIGGFPATVCIMTGWLPVALAFTLQKNKEKNNPKSATTSINNS
jgi:hypothetical protein